MAWWEKYTGEPAQPASAGDWWEKYTAKDQEPAQPKRGMLSSALDAIGTVTDTAGEILDNPRKFTRGLVEEYGDDIQRMREEDRIAERMAQNAQRGRVGAFQEEVKPFDWGATATAARGALERSVGGAIRFAGQGGMADVAADVIPGGRLIGDAAGAIIRNTVGDAMDDAGAGIAETGAIRQGEVADRLFRRPDDIFSLQGARYLGQQAAISSPNLALSVAGGAVNPGFGLGMAASLGGGAKYDDRVRELEEQAQEALRTTGSVPLELTPEKIREDARKGASFAALAEAVPEMLPMAAAFGQLSRFMPDGVFKTFADTFAGRVATTGVTEGVTEAITESANIAYETFGEDKPFAFDDFRNRVFDAFAVGGISGSAIGGAVAAVDPSVKPMSDAILESTGLGSASSIGRDLGNINKLRTAREIAERMAPTGDPDIDAGAKLADEAMAQAEAARPTQLVRSQEIDALLGGSGGSIGQGGANPVSPEAGAGSFAGFDGRASVSGPGSDATRTGSFAPAQFGGTELAGEVIARPAPVEFAFRDLPDGSVIVSGDPLAIRQRAVESGIEAQGMARAEGVRFPRESADAVRRAFVSEPVARPTDAVGQGSVPRVQNVGLEPGAVGTGTTGEVASEPASLEPPVSTPVPPALRDTTEEERQYLGWLRGEIKAASAERGGKVLMDQDGNFMGRTSWPDLGEISGFWAGRPKGWTADRALATLDKAERGEPLTKAETNFMIYAREWMRTYAEENAANVNAMASDSRLESREEVQDDILAGLQSVADTSPQQRASVVSLGADYTDQIREFKRARAAGQLDFDGLNRYAEMLEMDRETGKVGGRPIPGVGNKTSYVDTLDAGQLQPVQAFLDADNFKAVNDKFGHDVGDDVIRAIGETLVEEFGAGNVWSRGGDEFLFQGMTDAEVSQRMERVRERMAKITLRLTAEDGTIYEQTGIGVSYGTGQNERAAEGRLKADKQARRAAGLRYERDESPDGGRVGAQPGGAGREAGQDRSGEVGPRYSRASDVADADGLARPEEDEGRKVTVYHGTSEDAINGIVKNGLSPRSKKNHEESGDFVYVEKSAKAARSWGRQANARRVAVIELEIPESLLTRDSQTLSKSSFRVDKIPAKYIKSWDIYHANVRTGELEFVRTETNDRFSKASYSRADSTSAPRSLSEQSAAELDTDLEGQVRREVAGVVRTPSKRKLGKAKVSDVPRILADKFGEKFATRIMRQPWMKVVDSVQDLPPDVRNSITEEGSVAGFVFDGNVYIIAGAVAPSQIPGLVMHEVGVHFGLPRVVGEEKFGEILRQFKRNAPKDNKVSRAYERARRAGTPEDTLDEEAFAYYVEENWDTKAKWIDRIADAVKSFLNRLGVPLSTLNASPTMLRGMAIAAAHKAAAKPLMARDGKVMYHKAWHGSPHDFDQFRLDDSTIGTGEGAQAFGHGLYFAGSKELAAWYRTKLSGYTKELVVFNGERYRGNSRRDMMDFAVAVQKSVGLSDRARDALAVFAMKHNGDMVAVDNEIGSRMITEENEPDPPAHIEELYSWISSQDEQFNPPEGGRLYEVELAPKEEDYLDWDKPLSEQSEKVRAAIEPMLAGKVSEVRAPDGRKVKMYRFRSQFGGSITDAAGADLYRHLQMELGSQKAASDALHAAGIPGIRYLDGNSRSAGEGNHNYVIFDDSLVEVRAKYSRIDVDGTSRPVEDSTGKRIHPTDEGVRNFWRWFADSRVVDDQGRPLVVYHGTTGDFDSFDMSRANPESDFGAGIYLTNNRFDVGSNYAGFGPDLTNKIEQLAERIAAETDRDYDDPDVIKEARDRFASNEGSTIPAFVSMQNPAIVGGKNETRLTYEIVEDEDGDIQDETGTLVDFVMALRNVAESYSDGSVEGVIDEILQEGDGVTLSSVYDIFSKNEEAGYYTDDNGVLVSKEILRQALEEAGFDGVIDNTVNKKFGSERRVGGKMQGMDKGTVHYIAFSPNQIKSAIGNTGSFSPSDDRILYSRAPNRTPEQEAALAKAGMPEDNRSLVQRGRDYIRERWDALKNIGDGNSVQRALDRFHRMSAIEQELGVSPERSAYISARLAAGLPSIMEGMMSFGAPRWDNGVLSVDPRTVGLLDALKPVADDINGWLGWMVGRRAKVLKDQGRENLMSDDDIKALLSLADGREDRFEEAALQYLRIKRAVLDVAEGAGLIDPESRKTWDSVEYIPFYRQDDEGDSIGPGTRMGLAGQTSGIKQLKGGTNALADPLGNIIRNFTKLVDASLKNNAMLQAVDEYGAAFFEKVGPDWSAEMVPMSQVKKVLLERGVPQNIIDSMPKDALAGLQKMWSMKPPKDDDVVRIMRNGKAEYYRVPDKELLRSLTSFKVPSTSAVVAPLKFFKQLLTAGVTSSPEFMARNYVRDSLSSWVIADDKFAVGWDSVKGVVSPLVDNKNLKEMMFSGATFVGGNFYSVGSDEQTATALRRALREKGLSSKDIETFIGSIASSPITLWDKWQKIGSYIENANRVAIYENALKAGRSKKEAAYLARDLMDFSMHGDSAFVQFLSDVLPFFNARLQGLYKLYRAGGSKALRKALLMRAGTITAGTMALMAWNMLVYGDGYDELEEWDKDTYWHIAPGTEWHIRVPKPFELGVIFATVPERVARAVAYQATDGKEGDRPKQLMESMLAQLSGTLAMNPIPQAAMPILEVWANKSFFTGRPIENMGDQQVLPEARAEWYTSDTAKLFSDAIGNTTGLSPKKIEHLWRGYTGTIGGYSLDAVDFVVRQIQGQPERPELSWSEMPLVKAFYRGDTEPKNTRYVTEYYELARLADQVSMTIKEFELAGEKDRAKAEEEKYGWLIGERVKSKQAKAGFMHKNVQMLNKTSRELSDIRKAINGVAVMPGFSDSEKRKRMEELTAKRNEIARNTVQSLRQRDR